MDAGAPEPALLLAHSDLLVAYFTSTESVAVLRFYNVLTHTFGPPNDERLHEHPLYPKGLKPYRAFEVEASTPPDDSRQWILTFHDDTLDVRARDASVITPTARERTPVEALAALLHASS
jgi:hypothetical protein